MALIRSVLVSAIESKTR